MPSPRAPRRPAAPRAAAATAAASRHRRLEQGGAGSEPRMTRLGGPPVPSDRTIGAVDRRAAGRAAVSAMRATAASAARGEVIFPVGVSATGGVAGDSGSLQDSQKSSSSSLRQPLRIRHSLCGPVTTRGGRSVNGPCQRGGAAARRRQGRRLGMGLCGTVEPTVRGVSLRTFGGAAAEAPRREGAGTRGQARARGGRDAEARGQARAR